MCSRSTWFFLISDVQIGSIQKLQMTASADKVLHGIIVTDMQRNGQIQTVFQNLTDNQHLPNEVAAFQEIRALFLVPPLHYWNNHFMGYAFLSCKMDGSIFTFSIHLLLFLTSQTKTKLCPDQGSKSCIFNSNGDENNMYVSKVWLRSNTLQSKMQILEKNVHLEDKSGFNNDIYDQKRGVFWDDQAIWSGILNLTVTIPTITDKKNRLFPLLSE